MISEIKYSDFDKLKEIVVLSVLSSITKKDDEAKKLIDQIVESVESWRKTGLVGFHKKYSIGSKIVGFIIVKEYWNLSQVFVCPEYQGKGIGRSLITAAINGCRRESPKNKIILNSSTVAAGFYEAIGFRKTGPGKDLPGGCIPFEYDF